MKPKICPKCHKEFIPKSRKQKYCCHQCAVVRGWGEYGAYAYEMQKYSKNAIGGIYE